MRTERLRLIGQAVVPMFTPIVDYCITKQPIPNSMRRNLMPLNPDLNGQQQQQQQHKTSSESLGVGVYSIIQPDNIQEAPVPKPRGRIPSNQECVYGMLTIGL